MSIRAMNAVFDLDVEPKEKVVLLVLADYADEDGYCFPGQQTISRRASIPERTLRRLLDSLEQRGLLLRERRVGERGERRTDGYRLAASLAGGPTGQIEGSYRPTVAGTKEPLVEPPVVNTRAREADDGFDAVWKAWPRKVKKVTAESAWKRLSRADRDAVLAAIPAHANGYRQHVEPQFVPHLSSWLNQRRWEEDPPQPPTVRARQAPSQLPASETSLLPKYDYTDQIGEDEWGFPVYRRIN